MSVERVVIVLDVTKREAWDIGNKLAGGPPSFEGESMIQYLEKALAAFPDGPRLQLTMRSEKSAELGGPDTPELVVHS